MNLELRRRSIKSTTIPKDAIIVAERSDNEAALMNVIYAQGWSASPKYMRKSEAEKVTNIGTAFKGNTAITDFSAFKYFTKVTSIDTGTFYNCSSLKSITLPNTLTYIGLIAFNRCTNLVSCKLPDGLKIIGERSFSMCSNLELNLLPSGVSIGTQAFFGCTKLNLTELPNVTAIPQGAFYNCQKLALTELPSSITSIANRGFGNCIKMTNVKILNTESVIKSSTEMFYYTTTIQVPSALLADYQADENWGKYKLVGY
jgi:hypothetical protein